MSCRRKGRAHYHLKECKEEAKCQGKFNPFVKHATEKFHPYEDKVFDKWLCHNYWHSLNWEPPCEDEEIQSCNYVCGHHSHGNTLKFCSGNAWHTNPHSFDCEHKEDYTSNIIDIVFCCDTTSSMDRYID